MLAHTSHRCICMYTYSHTRKPMYLYACIADVYLVYICTYLHFCVAWVKIQIVTFTCNAFHSTLLAEWNGKKTRSLPPNILREKTLSFQLWHYFSPLLLCEGSPGLASLPGNFHRDLCYCFFPRSHSIFCLGVTNPVPRLCRAESTYWLANAAKHGPASQLLISTDVWYGFPSCMGSGAC